MQRILIIGEREIVIAALGQPMDHGFERLYAAYFGNAPLGWDELTVAALQYFDINTGVPGAADAYFNNFTPIWRSILETGGRLERAEDIWQRALQPAQQWEQTHRGQRLHKGTAYYFWGMTALLRGDIDHGYLLIHQAVEEDIRTSGQQAPPTPAYALVTLNYEEVHQFFHQWVLSQASFLNNLIQNYNSTHSRTLTVSDVKRRFIDAPPSIETVFLLTYTIARLMRITPLPDHMTSNAFAGQLQLNLLFDITLVIDTAIKEKNPSQWQFVHHAEHLLTAAGHRLRNPQLRDINSQFENAFESTLQSGLDGTLVAQTNHTLDRLQCDVALAYGLRNHSAHNIETTPTVWNRSHDLQAALFRVFCATVDYLY